MISNCLVLYTSIILIIELLLFKRIQYSNVLSIFNTNVVIVESTWYCDIDFRTTKMRQSLNQILDSQNTPARVSYGMYFVSKICIIIRPHCILWTIFMTFYTHLHINLISRAIISHLRYQIWLSLSLFVFYGICQLSVLIPMFSLVATLMAVAGLSLDGSLYVFGISRLLREQTSASTAKTHHPTENHDLPHTKSIVFILWSL